MATHYNAFISYRHHPDDIRVAEEIHRSLEHYHIPRALRQKSGKNLRLFRDKEELPITSNLSDDIHAALIHSDYLIVICSTHTGESVWVQREIRLFLETHDRSRILTVLVNGEPYDTIPDLLLHDDEGRDIEPLSCDWRQPRKIARREELPRLAAALLQCRYDDLRQREQRYRARKHLSILGTALAVCLVFMGYFLYSSLRIQENLDKALRNQSVYLSSESRRALEEGDRMTAIALALEALPDETGDRPYVPAASLALSEAMGLYFQPDLPVVAGIFPVDSEVMDFNCDNEANILYISETSGKLSVWDANSFELLGSQQFAGFDGELQMTASENVVFHTDDWDLVCCGNRGEILWRRPDVDAFAFTRNRREILTIESSSIGEGNAFCLVRLDADTGLPVGEALDLSIPEDHYPTLPAVDNDRRAIVQVKKYGMSIGDPSSLSAFLMAVDLNTGETLEIRENMRFVKSALVDKRGNLIVLASIDGSGMNNGSFYEMITTGAQNMDVICFDGKSGGELWRQTVTSYSTVADEDLYPVPNRDWVLCKNGEMLVVFDCLTGERVAEAAAPARPLDLYAESKKIGAWLANGYFYSMHFGEPEQTSMPVMAANLYEVKAPFSCEIDRKAVSVYRAAPEIEGVNLFAGAYASLTNACAHGSLAAGILGDETVVFDCSVPEMIYRGDESRPLGFSPDGSCLWTAIDGGIARVDLITGTAEELVFDRPVENYLYELREMRMFGGDIFAFWRESPDFGLMRYSTETGETEYWTLTGTVTEGAIVAASEDYALVLLEGNFLDDEEKKLVELNLKTGEERLLEETDLAFGDDLGSDLVAVSTWDKTELRRWGGDPVAVLDTEGAAAASFRMEGDRLLALCSDEVLRVYDRNGTLQQQIRLELYGGVEEALKDSAFSGNVDWTRTEDGRLTVQAGSHINVLDLQNFALESVIPVARVYVPGTDSFLIWDRAEDMEILKAIPRYSLSQIVQKGRNALNGFRLTEEQRQSYGLD